MSWQHYNLTFRLLSPLHIGWRKTGNLQQTRGYLPGKNLWAALTARLTRAASNGANATAYQAMGNLVQQHFRFTYFYPALPCGKCYTPHYPWQDDFDYLFLDSYASAALNYTTQSAEDGLLHETEFIAPHTRTNQPVYLTGSLYVQTNLPDNLQKWQNALNQLQFGGERGYGWGRVKVVSCDAQQGESDNTQITIPQNQPITAHLHTEKTSGIVGLVEPVIGWERNNHDSWRLSAATICYAPGAIVTSPKMSFTIGDHGIWQPVVPA